MDGCVWVIWHFDCSACVHVVLMPSERNWNINRHENKIKSPSVHRVQTVDCWWRSKLFLMCKKTKWPFFIVHPDYTTTNVLIRFFQMKWAFIWIPLVINAPSYSLWLFRLHSFLSILYFCPLLAPTSRFPSCSFPFHPLKSDLYYQWGNLL